MGAGGGRHPDDFEIEANQKIKVIKANSTFSRHQSNMCGRFTLYSTCEREGKNMALVFIAACCGLFGALRKSSRD
jgi:hypothetical protein